MIKSCHRLAESFKVYVIAIYKTYEGRQHSVKGGNAKGKY